MTFVREDRLPEVEMAPTPLQLFRYSAVTWNGHRIHYDRDWAEHEGHAGLVVHSHLHAANAIRAVTEGLGPDWHIAAVRYRIVRPAIVGDTLYASAEVVETKDDGQTIEFSVLERNQHGETCLDGSVTARLRA